MTVWRGCSMDSYYETGEFYPDTPCEVRISGGTIAVSYVTDDQFVVYEGPEIEPGHFELTAPKVSGRATLHRFQDDEVLEGSWSEDGLSGMWRIILEN